MTCATATPSPTGSLSYAYDDTECPALAAALAYLGTASNGSGLKYLPMRGS